MTQIKYSENTEHIAYLMYVLENLGIILFNNLLTVMFPSLTLLLQAVSAPFKRSQLGLFHGKTVQYGNNVPFSKHKTRRRWLPNIQSRVLRSETLEKNLRIKVTMRALKTIKKVNNIFLPEVTRTGFSLLLFMKYGGLDQYVLNTRHELLGHEGMRLRILVRDKLEKKGLDAPQKRIDWRKSETTTTKRELIVSRGCKLLAPGIVTNNKFFLKSITE